MAKNISIYRRRAGLIDMNWPTRLNVKSYILKFAYNFDGTFIQFANLPATGFRSANANTDALNSEQFRGKTRVIVNPSDFGLDDTKFIWIKKAQIDINNNVGPDEIMTLVMPYSSQPRRSLILAGTVKQAANISDSLDIDLPIQCTNQLIQNTGSNNLAVAFEPTGQEFTVYPLTMQFTNLYTTQSAFSQIFLRGVSGDTTINAEFAIRNEGLY